jgi:hypothetical protein
MTATLIVNNDGELKSGVRGRRHNFDKINISVLEETAILRENKCIIDRIINDLG